MAENTTEMMTTPERKPGRPFGARVKYGSDLRAMILQAMELEGDEIAAGRGEAQGGALAFVRYLARTFPEKFVDLIKASMPKQVDLKFDGDTSALLTRFLDNADERRGKLIEIRKRFEEQRVVNDSSD